MYSDDFKSGKINVSRKRVPPRSTLDAKEVCKIKNVDPIPLKEIPYDIKNEEVFFKNLNQSISNSLKEIIFSEEEVNIKEFISTERTLKFIYVIMRPLFWYLQKSLCIPTQKNIIKGYKEVIADVWSHFMFDIYNDTKLNKKTLNGFFDCFPYLSTQIMQDMFIKMSNDNPVTAKKEFRMKICSLIVPLFTSVDCIDVLELQLLSKYFKRPPLINEIEQKKKVEEEKNILLPKEDLTTLTPPVKKVPQKLIHFHPTTLTPLMQVGLKRELMPFTKKVKIDLIYPKNGAKDLKVNFPELLPDPKTEESLTATVNTYDPMKETRSLLHRAQRKHIIDDYSAKKKAFFQRQDERAQKFDHIQDDLTIRLWQVEICKPETLTDFDQNIKKLIDEKKHDETPEFSESDERLTTFTKERLAGTYWNNHPKAKFFYNKRKDDANANVFEPNYKEKEPLFHHEPVYNIKIEEPLPDVFDQAITEKKMPNKVHISKQLSNLSKTSLLSEVKLSKDNKKYDNEGLQKEVDVWKGEIDENILHFRIMHEDLALDLENEKKRAFNKADAIKTESEEKNRAKT